MRVFIAEKPELGRAIADALGGNQLKKVGYIKVDTDVVTWCFGHLLALKEPHEYNEKYKRWELNDLPFKIDQIGVKPISGKNDQIKLIKNLVAQASEVVHAGDNDEEGQLLVDRVLEYVGNNKPTKRILINDNTKSAVQKALNNLKDNEDFVGLRNSAYARGVADWIYGLNLTRAYTVAGQKNGYCPPLTLGRVQTPILNLVLKREQEVASHKKELFYNLMTDNGFKFELPKDKLEDKLCKDKSYITEVQEACTNNNNFVIEAIEVKQEEVSPPLPYSLLELQTEANQKYKYKPDQTQNITQSLREKHKAITYNRSDCQYLTDDHYAQREEVFACIKNNLVEYQEVEVNTNLKSRAFNNANVSAHHAIIPTINKFDISVLSTEELNIYKLIAEKYVLQFLPNKRVEKTIITAKNNDNYLFKLTTSIVLSKGWTSLAQEEDKEDKEQEITNVHFNYKQGDLANFEKFNIKEGETKPKQLYTEGTLLKELPSVAKYVTDPIIKKLLQEKDKDKKGENGGIGTPATRASIIKGLFDKKYLEEQKGKIVTTTLGKELLKNLPEENKLPDRTALWAEKQRMIKDNEITVASFLEEIKQEVAEQIAKLKSGQHQVKVNLPFEATKKKTFKKK